MGFWLAGRNEPPPDWALSMAVVKARQNNMLLSDYRVTADMFLNYRRGARGYKQDLINLYEALRIIGSANVFGGDTNAIFQSIWSMILVIIEKLRQDDSFEILCEVAGKFKELMFSGYRGNAYAAETGKQISTAIRDYYRVSNSAPPDGVLQQYNPQEWRMSRTEQNPAEPLLRMAILIAILFAVVCSAILFVSPGGFVQTIISVAPDWLIVVMTLSAVIGVMYSLLGIVGRVKSR